MHSRLVRERTLNPIGIGIKRTVGNSSNGHNASSTGRRKRPADPAWSTPSTKRNR